MGPGQDVHIETGAETMRNAMRPFLCAAVLLIPSLVGCGVSPAEHAFNQGLIAIDKKDFAVATTWFTEAIRLKPDDARAYGGRAFAYANSGDHDKAIADYTEAIRLKPDFVEAYDARASSYGSKGDYDRAIADETEAIRLVPNDPRHFKNRALAYDKKGEKSEAEADRAEAKRLLGQ
jgi:tetratricopeptide (TPR) repeat protein